MPSERQIVRVASARTILEPEWLARGESVHRQLRPDLPADYPGTMSAIVADGAGIVAAVGEDQVLGLAVFRSYRNTSSGVHFYIDDLVVDASGRSEGTGGKLLDWLADEARGCGARRLQLDSGTQRVDAHRFYHREGMHIACFHFSWAV